MIEVKIGNRAAGIIGIASLDGVLATESNKSTTSVLFAEREDAEAAAQRLRDVARSMRSRAPRDACYRAVRVIQGALRLNASDVAQLKAALFRHGAQPSHGGSSSMFRVDTPAGVLRVSPYEPTTSPDQLWVHARFDEPERALRVVEAANANSDLLNPHSGKWNYTSHQSFIVALDRLMTYEDASARKTATS